MHASAAEIPELEMRQKELQEQVSGFESQKEAAVSASKQVRHLCKASTSVSAACPTTTVTSSSDAQNAAIIQDTIASSQLKDTELSQLHADISCKKNVRVPTSFVCFHVLITFAECSHARAN